ncbi:MAG: isoquinoline 1-oxidoreductase subunit beta, partial [Pseudomonadota bacterium]|nr:isoquinoline 1-oxidoreductase subunit beta [Pseudomonadota bacterium]
MNTNPEISNVSTDLGRRRFLQGSAGLTLGFCLPAFAAEKLPAAGPGKAGEGLVGVANPAVNFEPNAFLRIGTDNSVTVISKLLELGQVTYNGLATILAEELDA